MKLQLPMKAHHDHRAYLYIALPMSVLETLGHESWIAGNLLNLYSWRESAGPIFINYSRLFEYRQVLAEELFTPDFVAGQHDIVGFLSDRLARGEYVTIFLDRSRLGAFFGDDQQQFLHEVLVYGLDTDQGVVHTLDFSEAGRFQECSYTINAFIDAIRQGTKLYGDFKYVAQSLGRKENGHDPGSNDLLAAAEAFAAGDEQPIATDWWSNRRHPDHESTYVYGSKVFDYRLILTEAFHGGGNFLQNVQVVEEHARAARSLFSGLIGGATFCPHFARYDELIRDLAALKLTVLRYRLHGKKFPFHSRPELWQQVSQEMFGHFVELSQGSSGHHAVGRHQAHAAVCRPGWRG